MGPINISLFQKELLHDYLKHHYSRILKHEILPFLTSYNGWQGASLFESGQFPSPLVGGMMHKADRLGTRLRLL